MDGNTAPIENPLGTKPLGRLLFSLAVPTAIANVVNALYNIVDQIFIANASYLGSYGNAANTVVFPLTVIALAVAAVFVFVERFIELRRARIDWHDFLKGVMNVLDSGNEEEALAICEDIPVPVTNIVAVAIFGIIALLIFIITAVIRYCRGCGCGCD